MFEFTSIHSVSSQTTFHYHLSSFQIVNNAPGNLNHTLPKLRFLSESGNIPIAILFTVEEILLHTTSGETTKQN